VQELKLEIETVSVNQQDRHVEPVNRNHNRDNDFPKIPRIFAKGLKATIFYLEAAQVEKLS